MATVGWSSLGPWLLLLLLGLHWTVASPWKDPNRCGLPSCPTSNKFNYTTGTSYEYQYSVDIKTFFDGPGKNESSMHIESLVSLQFFSECEAVMKVSRVSLTEKGPEHNSEDEKNINHPELPQSDDFRQAVEELPVRFSFLDGTVTEVCPDPKETSWVLNFKKGVLSALQNSMKRFDVDHDVVEADVNGYCETNYRLMAAKETSLIISKNKDLSSCAARHKHYSIFQTTPYVFRGNNYEGLPLMKSRSSCELSVDHHIYEKIICEEEHVFQPFSSERSGAKTEVKQVLTLLQETNSSAIAQEVISKRATLLFEHDLTPKPTSGELKASRDLIKAMCRLNTDDVEMEFPDVFTKFIHTARLLSYPALSQAFNRANSMCSSGRKHVQDALPLLGSNAAIALMRDIMLKKAVPDDVIHEWLFALAFIPRPDDTTVTLMMPLLRAQPTAPEYMLSVSAVLHSYCKWNPHCDEQPNIQEAVSLMESSWKDGCGRADASREMREKALVALKALGNLGVMPTTFTSSLHKCINNDNIDMSIRVAAIEAHRRLPCELHRNFFLEIFRDQTHDSEVRIAAYLSLMKCPNYNVIKMIKHSLTVEEVNQVGSFVWSHLENLQRSSIPSRVEIQGLLQDKDLGVKFSSDARKFSHNYEGSVFFDEFNAGGNYESNIIFSPKSYVPRSGMLNLTVDLFGESVNVFEVSGRMEGFEHYVESLFGPTGPFSSSKVADKLDKFRFSRSTTNEIVSQVDNLPNAMDNNIYDPKVSLGLKIFGNELKHNTFNGHQEISAALSAINPVDRIKQLLSGKEVSYNKASLFLDTSHVLPTGTGLPISLTAVGTAAVNLKLSGSVKAADFIEGYMLPTSLDVAGKIRPSVAVNVVGTMAVDAYYTSTAIKLKSSLYSSAAVEAQLKVRGAKLVSLSFSLPKEKTDLISTRSELVVVSGEKEIPQAGTQDRVEDHVCSVSSLDRTLGLNFCVDFGIPNATLGANASTMVMNGPTSFGVSVKKADPTAKQYLLEYKWTVTENASMISLVFDTPGSQLKRELSARIILDMYSQNATMLLQSADSRFQAHGKYKYTDDEKYLTFGLNINGKKHFDAEIGLNRKENKHGYTYQPKLYLAVNSERVAELSGSVKWMEKKSISRWDVDLKFQTKKVLTTLGGYVQNSEASVSFDIAINYEIGKTKPEFVGLKGNISNKSSKSLSQVNGDLELESSAYPHLSFVSSLKFHKGQGHVECNMEVSAGPLRRQESNKLTLRFVFTFSKTYEGSKMNTFIQITKPITSIDIRVGLNYHSTGKDMRAVAIVRYATGKEITVTLELDVPRGTLTFVNVKLNVTLPAFVPMILTVLLQEKTPNEYDVQVCFTWFSGHNFTAEGRYQDRSSVKAISHTLKLLIKSPSFSDISVTGKVLNSDKEFRMGLEAEHNSDKYSISVKHMSPSAIEFESYVELRWKTKVYSASTYVNMMQRRQVLLELHIDKLRDVSVALRGINMATQKEAGIEVKWDVNREPDQKFAASVVFSHPARLNYSGDFMVAYPSRIVRGDFVFAVKGTNYVSSAKLEWSPKDAIDIKVSALYEYEQNMLLQVKSQLLTPFENWKRTSISGGVTYEGNLVRANGSMYWQDDQHVAMDLFGNYVISETQFLCEVNSSVASTIPQVSSMSASLFHKHDQNKVDTNVHLQYKPKQIIAVKSSWLLEQDPSATNVTGTVYLTSPYNGFHKGTVVSKVTLTKDWDVRGAANVELDKRKYILAVDGHLKHFTNSMLVFNLSTPLENYKMITGRFGYSETQKHLVAEVKWPNGATGVEVLFSFINTANFDIKFSVATPTDFIQNVLLIGKLNADMIEVRAGLNDKTLGFSGKWHYDSITNFDYCYKIYTPIEGFEENGIIAKLIHENGLDFELFVMVTDTKLGVKVHGAPKPRVFEELHLESQKESSDDDYSSEEDDENGISWMGILELDTILYPTMKGSLDIENQGNKYTVIASLILPDGKAEIIDEFDMEDFFTISNKLQLTTPCECFKELNSDYQFHVLIGEKYLMFVDVKVKSHNEWLESGMLLNYTVEVDEDDDDNLQTHAVRLHIYTPLEAFQLLDTHLTIQLEDHQYTANVTIVTRDSNLAALADVQLDYGLLEASVTLSVDSPLMKIAPIRVMGQRDFTQLEKKVILTIDRQNPAVKNFTFEGVWLLDVSKYLKLHVKMQTPFKVLPFLESSFLITNNTEARLYSLNARLAFSQAERFTVNMLFKHREITAHIETPFSRFRSALLNGTFTRMSEQSTLRGSMISSGVEYDVSADVRRLPSLPLQVQIVITPIEDGEEVSALMRVTHDDGGYKLLFNVDSGKDYLHLDGGYCIRENVDWSFHYRVNTTHVNFQTAGAKGFLRRHGNGNLTAELVADTPLQGLPSIVFNGYYLLQPKSGDARFFFDVTQAKGEVECHWVWAFMENMGANLLLSYTSADFSKHLQSECFYRNAKKSFKNLSAGVDINLDKGYWQFGSNATVAVAAADNIAVELNLKVPPHHEVHTVRAKYQYSKSESSILQHLSYRTHANRSLYALSCEGKSSKEDINGNLKMEWGRENLKVIDNILNIRRRDRNVNLVYRLKSPRFLEDTFKGTVVYDHVSDWHNVRTELFYPGSKHIVGAVIRYQSLSNMNGTVNSSTPFHNLPYAGFNFIAATNVLFHQRFVEVFWPNNTALFNSNYNYENKNLDTKIDGSVVVEVPLTTRHVAQILYGYNEGPVKTLGTASVQYNGQQFLEGKYTCDSVSRAGFDKDVINIEIKNDYAPIGIVYEHSLSYSGGNEGTNLPTTDVKRAEIFKLNNRTSFHLTGQMTVLSTFTGQQITLTAIHANRTVNLKMNYDFLDHIFKQNSILELGPNAWSSYDIIIFNRTTAEKQQENMEIKFAYPKRNYTLKGYYQLSNNSMSSEATLLWDQQAIPKTMAASMDWKRLSSWPDKQHAVFSIKHPSFVKDVTLDAHYFSDDTNLIDVKTDLVYSPDNRHKLSLSGKLVDNSQQPAKDYKFEILGNHPATRLMLIIRGELKAEAGIYQSNNLARYNRSFLTGQEGVLRGRVDTRRNEIELERRFQKKLSYLNAKVYGHSPLYMANGTLVRNNVNSTGYFYLHLDDHIVKSNVNMTPDASESFHVYGDIPDARNAIFNMWRDYEDISISDVSFYLRLNHSRLVTSKAKWRPEIQDEIKNGVEEIISSMWNGVQDTMSFWKEYIKSETLGAVDDIWLSAKPTIQQFLNDASELKVVAQDLEELKIFLNNSYNANEFYIRDIVAVSSYVIDELALRDHIGSLPNFLSEMWEVMGESGESVRKSLLWIIETIKSAYHKAMELINSLLAGDSTAQLSALIEKLMEKYDKFIKDLHVSFVKHVEHLWIKTAEILHKHWNNLLKAIEPTFIQILHYLETVCLKASKEILDFLYDRKNDIIESPYFAKFANFSADVDKFYKDITKNDTITNIKKYSKVIYEFLKEKYFTMVPFGKELQEIVNEIIDEFKELQKLPSINYAVTKYNEMYDQIMWLYDYMDLGTKIQDAITLIHLKLTDITQTALQAENRYREAKTKFIFDPENGNIELEQKLPVSWHAFNETPKYEEIPEYKVINDLQNYFVASNTTFWTIYYEYKPYTEPANWLPPFKAQAMVAGTQHYVTFDKRFFEFRGSCSYLLASDFVDRNFSIVIKYDESAKDDTYELAFIVGEEVIVVDIFLETVRLEGGSRRELPLQIGDTYVYQEASMVFITSERGFGLQCNLKFKVCTVKLSGWYYGKTAGLLGTMDNEPSDDFRTSTRKQETDVALFARSWAIDREKCQTSSNHAIQADHADQELILKCQSFFQTKTSQFSPCFAVVDPNPFLQMCLNSPNHRGELLACTAAVAYMEACHAENTPLRIPDACVKCHLVNRTEFVEGDFVKLEGASVPQSTDVVFIIEAKACNSDLKNRRNIDAVVSLLSKELMSNNITSNRFAVVVFGGDGVYDQPRSIVINNNVFTLPRLVPAYFENIPTGDGNTDIFGALRYAAQLLFRPGVSKTFILMPCTSCDPSNMTLDYTVLHQVLLENDISLHILMNDEFRFEKDRVSKIFYGLDGFTAYTKRDVKKLTGSTELWRQVRLPKATLGYCTPLALETNGTVFTAKKLESEKKNAAKKFISVFAKRVAQSATPCSCQTCECTADNNGMSYMECFPCEYPTPFTRNHMFYGNLSLPLDDLIIDVLGNGEEHHEDIPMVDDD